MYRIVGLFFVYTTIFCSIANANEIEPLASLKNLKPYNSYSYTLMDEINIQSKNDYGKTVAKTNTKANKHQPSNSAIKTKNFIDSSIYDPHFQDILSVYSLDSNLDIQNQYTLGNFSARLNYFTGREKRSKAPETSLHIDYNLAPGISPYVATTYYKSPRSTDANLSSKRHKRSTLFLIGTKIEF
jgi:hypothetical protein